MTELEKLVRQKSALEVQQATIAERLSTRATNRPSVVRSFQNGEITRREMREWDTETKELERHLSRVNKQHSSVVNELKRFN